jgi:hypothetical protein
VPTVNRWRGRTRLGVLGAIRERSNDVRVLDTLESWFVGDRDGNLRRLARLAGPRQRSLRGIDADVNGLDERRQRDDLVAGGFFGDVDGDT